MSFLENYEPVDERLQRFWADHAEGSVVTNIVEINDTFVLVEAEVYPTRDLLAANRPLATGLAMQRFLTEPPKKRSGQPNYDAPEWTAPVEVCETSAIGRALANAGYSGKRRPSREEMQSASRASRIRPAPPLPEYLVLLKDTLDALDEGQRTQVKAWWSMQGFGPLQVLEVDQAQAVLDFLKANPPEDVPPPMAEVERK